MSLQDQFIYFTSKQIDDVKVNYLSRDFNDIRNDLINYLKLFFPEQWQDFNIASPGMAMLELNAYVGDLLSYVVDKKYNELFIDGVSQRSAVYRMAKTFGYKAPGVRPAVSLADIIIQVPVTANGPNESYLPIFRAGANLQGAGQIFETDFEIDFSSDFSEVGTANRIIQPVKNSNEDIIKYNIIKREKITAGVTKIAKIEIATADAKTFYQYTLPESNVLDVIGVIIMPSLGLTETPTYADFNDNTIKYWEVDFLPENKVFIADDTTSSGVNGVKIGNYLTVTKRFVKEFMSDGKCRLTFGGGEEDYDAYTEYISSLGAQRGCTTPPLLSIENVLNNTSLGEMVPANSTMYIKYRVGGGLLSNVGSNVLTKVSGVDSVINGPDDTINQAVISSVSSYNPIPAMGGMGMPTVSEIKHNISANFASQMRCVTLEDYISRAYQLPGKFGGPFRIYGEVEDNKVKMYILSRDGDGRIVTSSTSVIKDNLVNYMVPFRMINDFVEINDGVVINLQIEVDLYVDRTYNSPEVKLNAINAVKDYFDIEKWQMNQHIYISQINDILRDVPGVINVVDIRFYNMEGAAYSSTISSQATINRSYIPSTGGYRTQIAFIDNTILGHHKSIFEIKFPEKDILIRTA